MNDADLRAVRLPDVPAFVEFAAVARWEHVTRAAEELGMSQSTLSRRLRRLEAVVGVRLVQRRGRGVELTRAGRRLAATVDAALTDLERGVADVVCSVDETHGVVAMAFLSTMGVAIVPRILREFRREHPGIGFQLEQDGHEAVLARLREGKVDVCLTSPLPDEPDLVVVPLHRQELVLTVPEEHPSSRRAAVDLGAVAGEPFVGFKPGYGMRRITEEWCRRAGFSPRLAFEGEDVATVRGMVGAGLGVALLPVSAVPAPGTAQLRLRGPRATRTIGLVEVRGREVSPPARVLQTFLRHRGGDLVAGPTPGEAVDASSV